MTHVYLNYPRGRVATHQQMGCTEIQKMGKVDQRRIRLDAEHFSREIRRFLDHQHRFESTASANDMWLEIDFEDETFEHAVLDYILQLLGARYSRLDGLTIEHHC